MPVPGLWWVLDSEVDALHRLMAQLVRETAAGEAPVHAWTLPVHLEGH